MFTVVEEIDILKMRNCGVAGAAFRSIVSEVDPGPVIVRFLFIFNSAVVKLIGLVTDAMLKVIVEASQAAAMAWRKLPAPLSRLLTTTGSVVQNGAGAGAAEEAVGPTTIATPKAISSNVIVEMKKVRRRRRSADLIFLILGEPGHSGVMTNYWDFKSGWADTTT
jgi:hypothetical protein